MCSHADAFHRDASHRRARQRQNDASAQHCAGACLPEKLVSVIDERRELFSGSSRRKTPGEALDVISGIPKGQAVQMALRTLSPQILLLDELGGLDEVTALEQGLFSGVDFIATLHAASPEEAVGRPQVQALQARGALHVLVWLKGRAEPGQVREVRFL